MWVRPDIGPLQGTGLRSNKIFFLSRNAGEAENIIVVQPHARRFISPHRVLGIPDAQNAGLLLNRRRAIELVEPNRQEIPIPHIVAVEDFDDLRGEQEMLRSEKSG